MRARSLPWRGEHVGVAGVGVAYYGLNHFQYRTVGEKHGDQVTYHVEVQKRYDWGVPSEHRRTQTAFGGPFKMELEQADLARLNSTGLARDFDVKGSSGQMRTTV